MASVIPFLPHQHLVYFKPVLFSSHIETASILTSNSNFLRVGEKLIKAVKAACRKKKFSVTTNL